MEFKDFQNNPQELIGKTVLYKNGKSYSDKYALSLHKIEKVTKTAFKISLMPDALFNFVNGSQKGLSGRMDMATISKCRLVSDEEANELRIQWKRNKEEKALREKMEVKFKTMTFEQLQKMELL